MTPQEIVKQGLEAAKDGTVFREWAAKWIPDAIVGKYRAHCDGNCTAKYQYSLADLAFRAREAADDKWSWACSSLWNHLPYDPSDTPSDFMADDATSYHWIVAGCLAREMQKKKEKP